MVEVGLIHSSGEASVKEVERRDQLILFEDLEQRFPTEDSKNSNKLQKSRLPITKRMVYQAYKKVRRGGKSPGIDKQTMKDYESNLGNNLFKLWNRLSSGSYFPKPVLKKSIPKLDGKERILGIPTVEDRIAQTVLKNILEPKCERIFCKDSYGYRSGKSAYDALKEVRFRNWRKPWVLELDIKGFFDSLDHSLMLKVLKHLRFETWQIAYIERWLKSPMVETTNEEYEQRIKGTPQGGVISPLLSNLFLHFVFDKWMEKNYSNISYVRYADDIILHGYSESQMQYIKDQLNKRFNECGLELHSEKTKIVYCQDHPGEKKYKNVSFDFLGYTFCPMKVKRDGRYTYGFNLKISKKSLKRMRQRLTFTKEVDPSKNRMVNLRDRLNPMIRGWINYFGKFRRADVNAIIRIIDLKLIKWLKRNFKRLHKRVKRSYMFLNSLRKNHPNLFCHWSYRNCSYG